MSTDTTTSRATYCANRKIEILLTDLRDRTFWHSWIYDIGTGLLKDLECTKGPESMQK